MYIYCLCVQLYIKTMNIPKIAPGFLAAEFTAAACICKVSAAGRANAAGRPAGLGGVQKDERLWYRNYWGRVFPSPLVKLSGARTGATPPVRSLPGRARGQRPQYVRYWGRGHGTSPVTFNSGAILAARRSNAPVRNFATPPIGTFLLVTGAAARSRRSIAGV